RWPRRSLEVHVRPTRRSSDLCATATARSCRCPCTSSAAGSRSSSRWRAVSRPTTSARIWPAGPQSVRRSPSWAARSRACAPDPGSGDESAPRPHRAAAGRTHLTGRVPGGSLAGGLRECREQVRVLVQPGLDGLGLAALAVLVDDHVLELAVLLVADLDVARELGDVRVVLGEALAGQDVEALRLGEEALGILERLHREGVVGPERCPEGDHD